MATIQVLTHSGASVTVYSVDNEPFFCEDDSGLYPTGTDVIRVQVSYRILLGGGGGGGNFWDSKQMCVSLTACKPHPSREIWGHAP